MFEKVNLFHPDKVADRIAGAIVDLCYTKNDTPKVACEVLIGHGECNIQAETSEQITYEETRNIVGRIAGDVKLNLLVVPQDVHLANNQAKGLRCGDNGIFKGSPITEEQKKLLAISQMLAKTFSHDGKYIINKDFLIVCQSNAKKAGVIECIKQIKEGRYMKKITVNPLGEWEGGTNVDNGATNRKLGSDMGNAVTGGGLHGKDLSKADVSVNIMCHLFAQEFNSTVTAFCAIGDNTITFKIIEKNISHTIPYTDVVKRAKEYIDTLGGFEKFAEWGLIRP